MSYYATGLAAAVREFGLETHEVAGWKTRGHGPLTKVEGIVAHHTAGPKSGNYPSLNVVTKGRSDLSGPLCNVGLARDGSVYVVAAGRAYHAGVGHGYGFPTNNANAYTIGIEAESTGHGDWTASQISAYPRLIAAIAKHYGFSISHVIGHLEWSPGRKVDPAGWPGGMDGLRRSAQAELDKRGKPKPPVKRPSKPSRAKARITRKLVVDGKFGPNTIKALQKAVGATADGEYGPHTKVALQRHLHVHADGVVGPVTVRALQRKVGAHADGVWGPKTTAALQRALNAGKF